MADNEFTTVAKGFDEIVAEVNVRVIEVQKSAPPESRSAVTKAAPAESNQVDAEDLHQAFSAFGCLEPLYDPSVLGILFEHSNSLRQNVDAYATNIDGFGHRFDPLIRLDDDEADKKIAAAISESRGGAPASKLDIAKAKAQLELDMLREKQRLEYFFEYCVRAMSFVSLRRRSRQDIEVTGNAYWEVLRNLGGDVARFVYVPAITVRLMPLDPEAIEIQERVRVSEVEFETVVSYVRFRKFVQVVEGNVVVFKELGDPRVISSRTGRVYETLAQLASEERGTRPATELIHFKIPSPRTAYGVPRWIGNLLAVVGSRQAEEVNFNYFENKSVPPLAVLVSGGRMTANSVDRVSNYIDANIRGKRNFHKILVLEAEPAAGASADSAGRMKIDIRPLTGAQHSDALFQNYDERNMDKVGQSFRLPRLLRGDIRDFNRSTADAALVFAEMQVFEPERQDFDFIINRMILPALKVRFFRFVSLAPVMRDPAQMAVIIKDLSNANVLTPDELRELASDVFNRTFRRLKAPWTKQPVALTVAGIPLDFSTEPGVQTNDPDSGVEPAPPAQAAPEGIQGRAPMPRVLRKRLEHDAHSLIAVRDAFRAIEGNEFRAYLLEMQQAAG